MSGSAGERPQTVADYVLAQPDQARGPLVEVLNAIAAELPGATQAIRYQMPTFLIGNRSVVHAGAWKTHISVYPAPEADGDFADELAPYLAGKGTLQFPLDQPMPLPLIRRVAAVLAELRT